MEIGNEIGQKIRSAIRAKLVELGAYVDDELPDYVMVMVANRKSEAQMCEDLSLFLGANTSKFTAWLHGLLQKLLSITSETNSVSKQSDEVKPVESASSQSTAEVAPEIASKTEAQVTAETNVVKASKGGSMMSKKREVPVKQPEVVIDDEPVIRLRLEHDEFEEESKVINDSANEEKPHPILAKSKSMDKNDGTKKSGKETVGKKVSEGHESQKIATHPVLKQSSRDASETHKVSSKPVNEVRGECRKRPRALESSVGAVVKRAVEETEEGYDPYHPAIGSVASVVKITERKSSVPPSLQANKTLLLLAMKEAEQSVARFRQSSGVDPSEVVSSRSSGSVHSRLGSTRNTTRKEISQEISLSPSSPPTVRVEKSNRSRKSESDQKENESTAAKVILQSVPEEDTRRVQCGSTGHVTARTSATQEKDVAVDDDVSDEQQLRRILIQQQQRLPVERSASPNFVVTLDGIFKRVSQQAADEDEEEDEDEEVEDLPVPVQRNVVHVKPQAQILEEEEVTDDDGFVEPSEFEPPLKKAKSAERCKFWPSCKNGESCSFHHPAIPCKMFPSCRYGDKCLYIHPNCKFDGVCRNPSCPYTHSSSQPVLPQPVPIIMPIRMPIFSFPSGPMFAPIRHKSSTAPAHPKQIRCKFFPNCTDMNCAFAHPKPCRYGLSCANKNACPFSHPQLPTKKQMKWVSRSAQQNV